MITDELRRVIIAALSLDDWPIGADTRATDVPGWDSLNHVNVILAVERHFQVRLKGIEVLRLKTVGDLQRLIDLKRQGGC